MQQQTLGPAQERYTVAPQAGANEVHGCHLQALIRKGRGRIGRKKCAGKGV